jgi:hypothetical protein
LRFFNSNHMKIKNLFITGILFLFISFGPHSASALTVTQNAASQYIFLAGAKFYRTELYFGMDIPGGGTVGEEAWSKFLNEEVTPKFPGGFTVVESYGQYKDKSGAVVKEKSRMLILLYPKSTRKENDPKIESIRETYKKAFKQESVMRLDIPQTVTVSF